MINGTTFHSHVYQVKSLSIKCIQRGSDLPVNWPAGQAKQFAGQYHEAIGVTQVIPFGYQLVFLLQIK